jgi:hypothetical protein
MNKFHIPELEICREKLENDILYYLKKENLNFMDRIILEISLKSKNNVNKNAIEIQNLNDVNTDFTFFIAGFLTAYENPLLYKLASSPLFHIQWTCEAHSLALLAEWMIATLEK